MSTPRDHHFIPKVYLKEFSNSQKQLFQLVKGYTNISIKSIGQICYKQDYFMLHQANNLFFKEITDQNHIEKNVFKKQENSYPKLLKKITQPSLAYIPLVKSEVIFFLVTLITIQRRNPTYRKFIIDNFKQHVISAEFKRQAEMVYDLSREIDRIDPVEYFEKYVEEATTNEGKQSDMYLQTFIDNENKSAEDLSNFLMRYKVFMYHAPFGSEFVTSDNPGFTMLPDGQLFTFGGFGLQFTFLFPLTPQCCLVINYSHLDQDFYSLTKDIHIVHTNKHFVDSVNTATYNLATEKVFSYNKNVLANITI